MAALVIACNQADHGEPIHSLEEQQAAWSRPGFDLTTDAWVAVAPGGQLAANGDVWARAPYHFNLEGYVHPDHRGRGLGTALVNQLEARVHARLRAAPPGRPARLATSVSARDHAARRILEQAGYHLAGFGWNMRIDMEDPPPAPRWPAGVSVRAFVPGQDDAATHAMDDAAFSDLAGYIPASLADWSQRLMIPGLWDPALWFLAVADEAIVGSALCYSFPETGWVARLSVDRAWRRHGVALGLLRHAMAEFDRRGQRRVELGVDAANATGATHVYERAGMHIVREFAHYEKVIDG